VEAGEVGGSSFFPGTSAGHVPAVALVDAALRAATTMLGRMDPERATSCVAWIDVEFPGLCARGVPADLRLDFPELLPAESGVSFEVVQGDVGVCKGRMRMSHSNPDDLLAPWMASPGKRARHALLDETAPWQVLVGPPRTTEECVAVDMVGPSVPGDAGVHPVSLVLEAARQVMTIVTRTSSSARRNAQVVVEAVTMALSVGEPWESYPEMVCWARAVAPRRISALIALRVGGVLRGSLLIDGRVLSPASHGRVPGSLTGRGRGVRSCPPLPDAARHR
jgi:hypothetical protein